MNIIKRFYKRRNERLADRGSNVRFDYDHPSDDYDWITINGVHTPIDKNGTIVGGAGGEFTGKKYTGNKMQRSKKRVGQAPEKAGVEVRGRSSHFEKRLNSWKKKNGGSEPDKDALHSIAYDAYRDANKAFLKAWQEYEDESAHVKNYALAYTEYQEKIKHLKEEMANDKTGAQGYKRTIASLERYAEELKNDPSYEKDKRAFDKILNATHALEDARADASSYMYNKGNEFKDYKEATAYLESSGWVKIGTLDTIKNGRHSSVKIGRSSMESVASITNAVETFKNDFPKMIDVVNGISIAKISDGAYGVFTTGQEVQLASKYFGSKANDQEKQNYERDMKNNFHPRGTTLYSVPYHEFTHAMEERMRHDDKNGKLKGKRPSEIVFERVYAKYGKDSLPYLFKIGAVSEYANRTYPSRPDLEHDEFLAEAMSEAYCSKEPRQVALAVREEFTKLYREIYGK